MKNTNENQDIRATAADRFVSMSELCLFAGAVVILAVAYPSPPAATAQTVAQLTPPEVIQPMIQSEPGPLQQTPVKPMPSVRSFTLITDEQRQMSTSTVLLYSSILQN